MNKQMKKLILSFYLGDKCRCGEEFTELEEVRESVWDPHEEGRISHKECYENKSFRIKVE